MTEISSGGRAEFGRAPRNATARPVIIRRAEADEADLVSSILDEAAAWLRDRDMPMWTDEELDPAEARRHVHEGLYHLAIVGGEPAGTLRFQLNDAEAWPELAGTTDSAFVHRVAVRRRFAGSTVSSALLQWAKDEARARGLDYLRLDCEAGRPSLRAVYEKNGFSYHSDFQFGPFLHARYEIHLPSDRR